ncbi:hypothetical protein EDC01DRAFT_412505 [Geopyxis carbonaria]|nr:hypothetical protein EDC01DRAFT_412505 [Geopyxis carbonaria]
MARNKDNVHSKAQIAVWKRQHALQKQAAIQKQQEERQEIIKQQGCGWNIPSFSKKQPIGSEPEKLKLKDDTTRAGLIQSKSRFAVESSVSKAHVGSTISGSVTSTRQIKSHWNSKRIISKKPDSRQTGDTFEALTHEETHSVAPKSKSAYEFKEDPESSEFSDAW